MPSLPVTEFIFAVAEAPQIQDLETNDKWAQHFRTLRAHHAWAWNRPAMTRPLEPMPLGQEENPNRWLLESQVRPDAAETYCDFLRYVHDCEDALRPQKRALPFFLDVVSLKPQKSLSVEMADGSAPLPDYAHPVNFHPVEGGVGFWRFGAHVILQWSSSRGDMAAFHRCLEERAAALLRLTQPEHDETHEQFLNLRDVLLEGEAWQRVPHSKTFLRVAPESAHHFHGAWENRYRVQGQNPWEHATITRFNGGLLVNLHQHKRGALALSFEDKKNALKNLGGRWTQAGKSTNWCLDGWAVPHSQAAKLHALLPHATWFKSYPSETTAMFDTPKTQSLKEIHEQHSHRRSKRQPVWKLRVTRNY